MDFLPILCLTRCQCSSIDRPVPVSKLSYKMLLARLLDILHNDDKSGEMAIGNHLSASEVAEVLTSTGTLAKQSRACP